ncbi:MAG: HD-GYP domain-containing protein [Pseudomonadota bacterium]
MLEVQKIFTHDLELGMYVSSLDRPWLETPFLLQGFLIETSEEIQQLRKHCTFVYIDSRRSRVRPESIAGKVRDTPRQTKEELFAGRKLKAYDDGATWRDEFEQADQALEELSQGVEEIFSETAGGGSLDMVKVRKSVEPMIDSILRNPDACIWLVRLKQQDSYTYRHSLGASIWAVALGRQLGLPKSDLRSLAIGGLLFDIGKLSVDKALLSAERPLTEPEHRVVREHVRLGAELVKDSGLMNQDVLDMVQHHHERHDGNGYPRGLAGNAIPIFARIAAIVDCYDAVTSHRPYAAAIAPSEAIKMLHQRKGRDFQPELVEEFIQAIGIYPAGSLVELTSGEVAVVVAEYRTRRLRPNVMVMLDANKQPVKEIKLIDLRKETQLEDGRPLDIVSGLEAEAHGIDMAAIKI